MANANTPGNNRTNAVRLPPALSPEQPGLTQPFRDFVARGWVSRIQYTVTPGSSTISVDLGEEVTLPEGKTNRVGLTPQVAKDLIIAAGLWQPGQKGTKTKSTKSGNALPLRSLCQEDFKGTDANLLSRIQSVAKNVGDQTARGRIGSLKMYKKGADTFAEWWKQAGPAQIGHLLVSKQHYEKLGVADFNRIKSVCPESPFRGDKLPTPPEDSDDKDEPDEEPIKPPPTRNGKGGAAQPAKGTTSQNGNQAKKEAVPKK